MYQCHLIVLGVFIFECCSVSILQAQWAKQICESNEKLTDVVMLDSATAIVVGLKGSILKTTNSGETWRNTAPQLDCNPNAADCYLRWNAASFYDSIQGCVVGGSKVLLTTDGGENWRFCTPCGAQEILSVFYQDVNTIFVGDDSGYLYISNDTGLTWNYEKLCNVSIRSIFFNPIPERHPPIYVSTDNTVYSLVTSALHFWKEEILQITSWGAATRGSSAKDGNPAFIVGYDGQLIVTPVILKKTFQDTEWVRIPTDAYAFSQNAIRALNDISVPIPNTAFACGDYGSIIKTTDSGKTWTQRPSTTMQNLYAIDFSDEYHGFAVGDSGTILYTSSGGEKAVLVQKDEIVPAKYELSQNYPNPFNPNTVISYELPVSSYHSLKIYDILGREVAVLVNEHKPAGRYSVTWDPSANSEQVLSSGVYFYQLQVRTLDPAGGGTGNFIQTRKLLLLK
jgi:photosystem II stability/assembly factor-like uncharacterized protein